MIYRLKTCAGEELVFSYPEKVSLTLDRDAPAHSLTARFPLTMGQDQLDLPEYHTVTLEKDGATFFRGLIDEQEVEFAANGASLTVSARSLAALLLDNEALPQTYYVPSVRLIYQRHAQPYGFAPFQGRDRTFSTKLQIEKGISEWEVIETFCRDYLETQPQVTLEGALKMEPETPGTAVLFSNTGGIPYASAKEATLRYQRISQVWVRSERLGTYSTRVLDEKALGEGINRRRLLNSVDDTQTPVFRGKQLLKKSREGSYELRLTCPGEWILEPETAARLEDPVLGRRENLVVAGIGYLLDTGGERTQVTLRKKWES